MKEIVRFDMRKKPKKEAFFLTPLAWMLSAPETNKRRLVVNKTNMEGLKAPYILLCTHHAFIDFKVTTKAIWPDRANYVVAIDGFIGREWLLRNVGAICKRKFTNDTLLVRHIRYALEKLQYIVAIYPEARYSLAGTDAILPESLGKMVKLFNHPVVVLNMHGNHLSQPVWNLRKRNLPIEADMTQIITKEEIGTLSVQTINDRIKTAFSYDEYRWQKEKGIRITEPFRAEGLHKILYQCPYCESEHTMTSEGATLSCLACGIKTRLEEDGTLKTAGRDTRFTHVPDWYEWERENVRKEVMTGTYSFEDDVRIDWLPNAKGYIDLGKGHIRHDKDGFALTGTDHLGQPFELRRPVMSMYGLHVEYDYFKKGDCLDLSTTDDTYYIYPLNKTDVVTKLSLATEELYKLERSRDTREASRRP
jgi:transcription elongation factor Elf1